MSMPIITDLRRNALALFDEHYTTNYIPNGNK